MCSSGHCSPREISSLQQKTEQTLRQVIMDPCEEQPQLLSGTKNKCEDVLETKKKCMDDGKIYQSLDRNEPREVSTKPTTEAEMRKFIDVQQRIKQKLLVATRNVRKYSDNRTTGSLSIPVSVNNVYVEAVVDTGSEVTIISTDELKRIENMGVVLQENDRERDKGCSVINRETCSMQNWVTLSIDIEKKETTWKCMVMDTGDLRMHLGMDFLREIGVRIDTAMNCVYIKKWDVLVPTIEQSNSLTGEARPELGLKELGLGTTTLVDCRVSESSTGPADEDDEGERESSRENGDRQGIGQGKSKEVQSSLESIKKGFNELYSITEIDLGEHVPGEIHATQKAMESHQWTFPERTMEAGPSKSRRTKITGTNDLLNFNKDTKLHDSSSMCTTLRKSDNQRRKSFINEEMAMLGETTTLMGEILKDITKLEQMLTQANEELDQVEVLETPEKNGTLEAPNNTIEPIQRPLELESHGSSDTSVQRVNLDSVQKFGTTIGIADEAMAVVDQAVSATNSAQEKPLNIVQLNENSLVRESPQTAESKQTVEIPCNIVQTGEKLWTSEPSQTTMSMPSLDTCCSIVQLNEEPLALERPQIIGPNPLLKVSYDIAEKDKKFFTLKPPQTAMSMPSLDTCCSIVQLNEEPLELERPQTIGSNPLLEVPCHIVEKDKKFFTPEPPQTAMSMPSLDTCCSIVKLNEEPLALERPQTIGSNPLLEVPCDIVEKDKKFFTLEPLQTAMSMPSLDRCCSIVQRNEEPLTSERFQTTNFNQMLDPQCDMIKIDEKFLTPDPLQIIECHQTLDVPCKIVQMSEKHLTSERPRTSDFSLLVEGPCNIIEIDEKYLEPEPSQPAESDSLPEMFNDIVEVSGKYSIPKLPKISVFKSQPNKEEPSGERSDKPALKIQTNEFVDNVGTDQERSRSNSASSNESNISFHWPRSRIKIPILRDCFVRLERIDERYAIESAKGRPVRLARLREKIRDDPDEVKTKPHYKVKSSIRRSTKQESVKRRKRKIPELRKRSVNNYNASSQVSENQDPNTNDLSSISNQIIEHSSRTIEYQDKKYVIETNLDPVKGYAIHVRLEKDEDCDSQTTLDQRLIDNTPNKNQESIADNIDQNHNKVVQAAVKTNKKCSQITSSTKRCAKTVLESPAKHLKRSHVPPPSRNQNTKCVSQNVVERDEKFVALLKRNLSRKLQTVEPRQGTYCPNYMDLSVRRD
ncbi:uncharacterized protein LOC105699005 [Orussus abietinus]|uniref:uncharacterized protein LOC105699005 n=1 Tax=Orussus abietinus TaxID=222816 RepID=UPI000625646B|nr:uncharacterized protein LOC105699005 [Orussus abietinus]XP_012279111.1 uncharacterized protein LOC105699005 [Orussus abietinus]XP_012279112.1 uncharacterized protein LOC105699005 [Orussus abietinus]